MVQICDDSGISEPEYIFLKDLRSYLMKKSP